MKSRLDFFLVAKNLTKSVRNSEIYPSIAPDHKAIYISLSWSSETPRGPGLWKFNNTLLNDEQYIAMIRSTYAETRTCYSNLEDKWIFWEMIKMEIRSATISYAKYKVKASYPWEKEIERQLDHLDSIICNNFFLLILIVCYKSTKTSKQNCDQFTRIEENRLCFGQVSLDREWRVSNKIFF